MRALRLLAWKSDPVLVDVPDPGPGPGEVVVRIGAAGVCHSDIHLMHEFDGGLPWAPPFTLGHENAGWVYAVGPGVHHLEIGQPVAIYGPWGCGRCTHCALGIETLCEDPGAAPIVSGGGGLGLDGGMADLMLVPSARQVLPLPAGLDPIMAAPLTDAGLTPYHAVRRSWSKLGPTATAVVIGAGGLGHMAVQILKATTSARIIAVDRRDDALHLAHDVGADLTVMADDPQAAAQIRAYTRGVGADVVLDFVGSDSTLALAAQVARTMADLTIVGLGGGTLPVSFFGVPYEVSIQTTYWGSRPELIEVLELGARGAIVPHVVTFDLEHAVDAYRLLELGELSGRAVVVPNGSLVSAVPHQPGREGVTAAQAQ
jgi:propanol-preferring alcohol dehydrogenase